MPSEVEFENSYEEDQPDEVSVENLHNAVVTATDWTTETVLSQLQRGNILLSPRFQRRDAWDISRKSRFLESLFLGLPVPQIVLAEVQGQRGRFLVLDGKQRLLSLMQFTGQAEAGPNNFNLRGLSVRQDLNGKTYECLSDAPEFIDDIDSLMNQTIRTVVIRNWPSNDFLYLVFVRLNTGSVQLSPQELRQALYPGPFVDFVDDQAIESTELRTLLRKPEPDFRMRDTELLLRHLAFQHYLHLYSGNLKQFLDDACGAFNDNWIAMEGTLSDDVIEFESAISLGMELFTERHFCRKWAPSGYQGQFNRAIFDVLSFYFADVRIREAARLNGEAIVAGFKTLCTESQEFVNAITSTTKSIEATFTRFRLWAETLRSIIGDVVTLPELVENRIEIRGHAEG